MDIDEDDELEIDEDAQVGGPEVAFNTVTKIFQEKAPRREDLRNNGEVNLSTKLLPSRRLDAD